MDNRYKNFKRYGNELRFHYCPICGEEKKNPDFTINIETGLYYCFSTGEGGNIKDLEGFDLKMLNVFKPVKQTQTKDFNKIIYDLTPLNDVWVEYLKTRGITSSNEGIKKLMRVNKYNSLSIPLTDGKNPIGIKYRTMDKRISSEKGSQSDYFINWHNIKDKEYLIIVEGEIDLLSSIEVGFNNVVSLPFGAQNLKCIDTQLTWIAQFEKIIIAVDNDEQGEKSKLKIMEKLYNIKERLYCADMGEFKDFNEILTSGGAETLKKVITGAEKVKDILSTPLVPSFFGEKGKFLFDIFSKYLKEKFNIIKIDGELHCYNEGVYTKGDTLEKSMIELIPNLKKSQRSEVLGYLNIICENKEKNDRGLIAFKNGIYNILNDELIPFAPTHIITNKIPWNYNPNAYNKLMDQTLNEFSFNVCGIRSLIDELVGYVLFNKNELGKAFIIVGDKANGKSTFLKILIHMIGKNNYSALSLDDIINSRFRIYQVVGKLLNVGDDIGNGYIPEAETLRKLVTGDITTAEQKGKDPIEFNCYAKFIFSANDIPRIKDPTGATARRIIIIPFKNKFDINNANYDPYFLDKIKSDECMEYLIMTGLKGLKRVLKNKKFSETEETKKLLDEFNKHNNPILEYIDYLENEFYRNITLDYLINYYPCMKILNGVYEFPDTQEQLIGFNRWAVENGYQKISIQTFKNNMCAQFQLDIKRVMKDGKKERYFIKK